LKLSRAEKQSSAAAPPAQPRPFARPPTRPGSFPPLPNSKSAGKKTEYWSAAPALENELTVRPSSTASFFAGKA
jgi:hypothetical protein